LLDTADAGLVPHFLDVLDLRGFPHAWCLSPSKRKIDDGIRKGGQRLARPPHQVNSAW
jgi:hypothetical protein